MKMDFVLERLYTQDKIVFDKRCQYYTCGRSKENEIVCLSLLVSRRHCTFFHDTEKLYVTDLQSSNGIFINGMIQKPGKRVELREHDIIGIGCSEINSDEPALYVYKVCVLKTSFAAEEANSSLLSRTILNCDTVQKKSASSKQHLEKECGSNSHTNCDTVVPCNISRGINSKAHISSVSPSEETNIHISDDDQSPHGNNTDNFVETKSDMEVEDDIEIIHMSCKKETKDWDAEQYNLKYEESLTNNNKSNFNGKEIQHYKKSQIKVEKTDKKMDTAIDGIGKYDTNDNNTDAKRRRITKQVSGDLGETSSTRKNQTFTKEPNFIYNNDQIIKLEDELQITDDEKTHASSKMICDTSPIRLRKIKQEPTTRFSEIDVVDLSDNEDGIFPYSQLFDIKFEDDTKSKVEIKKECVNDDTEKVDLLDADDEVIILTDSEDEDNPWLHRLSRSQLVNEDKKREMSDVIIKDEIDLGIWEDDDISNIIESGVPHTSKDVKNIIDTQPIDTDATTACVPKKISIELCISVNDKTENETNSGANLLTTKIDMMDVGNIASSNEPDSRNGDHTDKRKAYVKEDTEVDKQTKAPNDTSSRISVRKRATTNEKLIPVIEPHILLKKRRSNKDLIKDCNKASKSSEDKSSSKLTTEENGMLKLKEKLDSHFYSKEQKHCAKSSKKVADFSISSKTKSIASISKEKKKMIVEERKVKLKKIAEEEKEKSSAEGDKTIKRGTAKPRAKVSLKNRGDFLINEQETHVSKRLPDKVAEQALSGSSKSTIHLTDKTNQLKEPVSNMEMKKSHKRQIDQDSISNVAASLQQSLHLDNIPETVKICKKNGSTKDFDATTDDIEKECSISKKKKKSDENAVKVSERVCELQETIDEYIPISIQKNNSSSNSTKSKSVARLKKKEVTFSEKVEIKEYEIDVHNSLKRLEGKDAPIPTNKLKVKVNCVKWKPKLEEFLLCIFMWNPVWLEEQRYLKSEPPIVKEDELQRMKLHYDSFQQYYKVVQPLLLHEIWHILTKDFEMVENNMQRVTAMCYIVANSITRVPIPSTDSFLTTLMIEVLVGRQDFDKQTHPNYGDLAIFEYVRDKNVRGKQKFQKLFAYITNVHQTIISDFTHYNKDLRNYVKNPYAVITYTMLTRTLDNDIIFNRVQRIRTITYLRASMRMVQALQYLPQSPLSQLILNPRIENYQLPPMDTSYTCSSLVTKDQLNAKQLEAVFRVTQTVLKKESKLCFIQGPPGTGKSKVIVNLVTQIYTENDAKNSKKFRILICAPSNAAIDEIVTRLLVIRSTLKTKRFNMVRIGRPETMHPSAKNISVTELAKRYMKKMADKGVRLLYENTASLREEKAQLEAEINSFQAKLANAINMSDASIKAIKRGLIDVSTKYQLLIGGKSIDQINIQDRVRYQRSAEDTILAGADIIACTLSSCYTKQMESIFGANKQSLPVCIVDEATQSCEAETLIPLMLGVNTLVLVGDPNQLPATILSQRAKKLGLDQSIFSRMQCAFDSQADNPIIMLNTQYRMAYDISYWPNKYFYAGQLKNSAENRQTFPFHPYRVLSHSFAQNDDKFTNTTEAEFVANIIFAMLMFTKWENTNGPVSLGVLTPYNNQRTIVLNKIQEKISTVPDNIKKRINFEVNTVDSFQGQERDIIIMSCVRSQGIGFLSDKQRLCVALTRAKYSLILCGNFNTFMRDHMWNALLSDARDRGILCNINANATPATIKKFIIQ